MGENQETVVKEKKSWYKLLISGIKSIPVVFWLGLIAVIYEGVIIYLYTRNFGHLGWSPNMKDWVDFSQYISNLSAPLLAIVGLYATWELGRTANEYNRKNVFISESQLKISETQLEIANTQVALEKIKFSPRIEIDANWDRENNYFSIMIVNKGEGNGMVHSIYFRDSHQRTVRIKAGIRNFYIDYKEIVYSKNKAKHPPSYVQDAFSKSIINNEDKITMKTISPGESMVILARKPPSGKIFDGLNEDEIDEVEGQLRFFVEEYLSSLILQVEYLNPLLPNTITGIQRELGRDIDQHYWER